jgi:tetratricopeptide (TPR) repeat protein
MADEEELNPPDSGENPTLNEAIEALRKNDPGRARELLTRLLKTDQNNVTYWVWLSAAVETQKERTYCLQTALQLDPENAAAKRGLVMLGAMPADDTIKPFPLNHPRLWEEKLVIEEAKPKKRSGMRKPLLRLGLAIGIGVVAIGLVYVAFIIPRSPLAAMIHTPTRRLTRTPTPTVTNTPVYRTMTPTFAAPTPLWMLLDATYTPTAQYVSTQHPVTSRDAFDAGMRYLRQGDYQNTIVLMEQILDMEPQASDAYYYIGESYRMMGNYNKALNAYQEAINTNPGFGPGYLGRALANQGLGQNEDVLKDLTRAIELDPSYDLPYVYRGAYHLEHGNPNTALGDLTTARTLNPTSALAYMYLAQAQLALDLNAEALESALKANELDTTLLQGYLVLGKAYQANGQVDKAMGALQTYTLYQSDNLEAMTVLGAAYNAKGEYEAAVDILSRVIAQDNNNVEANYQRGIAHLNLGNVDQAVHDFKVAIGYDSTYFEAAAGLALAYDLDGHSGDAYLQMEAALGLAETDEQKAFGYYYEATFLEKINDLQSARLKWRYLLALPEEAMPEEWRNTAMDHLGLTATPTKYSSPTPVMRLTTRTPQPTP